MATINRTITNLSEIVALKNEPEGETLDYKTKIDPDEWWELAKDVASFANHIGGVIVIGAQEDKKTGLPTFFGLTADEAFKTERAYEHAARDHCRPSPVVTFQRITLESGKEVLTVNVQAFATGIVGADYYTLDGIGGKVAGANAWQFFQRIGKHGTPLPLEIAILNMSAQTRRTAILLAQIPLRANVKLTLQVPPPVVGGVSIVGSETDAVMGELSIERNTVIFRTKHDTTFSDQAIPLDDIQAVWRGGDDVWCVRIAGYFWSRTNEHGDQEIGYRLPSSG